MGPHDWFVQHRASFVIRTLEPDEERVYREHLLGCEACRRETEILRRDLAWLPMGVAAVAPRPGLVHRLTEAAMGRRQRRLPRLVAAVIAASGLVAVASLGWARASIRRVEDRRTEEQRYLERELAAVRDTLAIIRSADRVRHAAVTGGEQQGGMVLFADDRSHRWNVVVYGVRAPRPGQVLQFWFITDKGMVRGVEVKTAEAGAAFLTMAMPAVRATVLGAAITLESPGGGAGPPAGEELIHLML